MTSETKPSNKKLAVVKSFRLFDFNTYDEVPKKESENSSGNDSNSDNGSDDDPYKRKYSAKDDSVFVIQMFGINEKGETACLYISDYEPFFFIKVGDNWTEYNMNCLIREIQSKLEKRYKDSIVSYQLVDYHKLYGFSGGKKSKFIRIAFKNTIAMRKVKNLWYAYVKSEDSDENQRKQVDFIFQGAKLELYESNIPPLLRYFHIQNISPSGWVCFKTNRVIKPANNTTTCKYEYICPKKELIPMPEKETRVPYKICSFDIEASSSHGDFPLPIKTYKRLATNLVDAFIRQSQFMDLEKAKLLLQKVIMTGFGFDSFDDVDLVYPKNPPSKERIKTMIKILKEESLEKAKKSNTEEDNSNLLTIDSIFEQMKEFQQAAIESEGNDGLADNESAMVANTSGVDVVAYSHNKYKKKTKVEKKATIFDILLSDSFDRDEKVQITNEVLTRLFPRLEGDKVTFIGSTFMKYGDAEPYLNHCLVLGSCDDVDGAVIESAETETDLLMKWTELIQNENPDIIIGYNIFGFDYEFMFRRAQENHCEHDFLLLSRKIGELCANSPRDSPNELTIENKKLVIASGEYDLRFFNMTGRLQIDMYAYFRRDFNLSSYKLDDVAGQFISDDVKKTACIDHPIFGNATELYSQNLMGLHAGDFIHIELSSFTSDYYKDGQKFKVLEIRNGMEVNEVIKGKEVTNKYNVILIGGHEEIDKSKSIKWCMAKDDVTPQDIFRLANGNSSDRAIVAKYCIQDCNLVHHLMNKIDVITGYIEMSSICSVPISFLVFRGQGIKLTSYVAKKCREKDTLMPDLDKVRDADGYEGAIVLPPKCSMYMDNPVACVDYSSLYPSSMISQNFSHDSKVWSKEYDLKGNLINISGERDSKGGFLYDNIPGYHYIDIEFDTYKYLRKSETSAATKTKVGKMICRWAQLPNNQKSIMPSILEELLKARSDTRKKIKTEKDPFMQNILDKRQLGYKVTANSLYGQCGSRTSTFYEKDVAACTTATGRMMIIYAKRIIEEVYGDMVYETACHGPVRTKAEYVYGDTDSVFFTFNLENHKTGEKIRGKPALEMTIEIAQDAAKLCSQWLKPPMELSYEKTLMPFILLSKKRYVGMLYEEDPNKGKMKYMGLSLKRRDSCDYLKDVYGGILNILMKENNIKSAIDFLEKSLVDLVESKVPMDKLTITKALRGYYKNPNTIGHKVLADRIGKRDPGNKPKPGDRMKFVFIVNDQPKALMGDKIETPEFIIQNGLKIDYTHYITNQLMKPLQQLFGLALEQIWEIQNKRPAIKTYRKEIEQLEHETPDMEQFMKKKEKYCSLKIKTLLFDKILNRIYNEKNRIQPITSFFCKR
uniref:DNA-directed DNA polymerase n=1 Tax=viral metagenome TaxID=1070528 RepID=A0A6C0ED99_9ZZZZ